MAAPATKMADPKLHSSLASQAKMVPISLNYSLAKTIKFMALFVDPPVSIPSASITFISILITPAEPK